MKKSRRDFIKKSAIGTAGIAIGGIGMSAKSYSKRKDQKQNEKNQRIQFNENWESLKEHPTSPEWFRDAKFGIYTHWGLPTVALNMVPEGSGWYGRRMYTKGSETYKAHTKRLGHPSEFGYHDFISLFKAEKFDAEEWAELFEIAGARFAGPMAEHHDGFAMWDSEVTPWNVADMGPKRDIAKEVENAVRKRGMKYMMSFHHASCGRFEIKDGIKMPSWFQKQEEMGNTDPKYRKLYANMPAGEFYAMWRDKLIECIDKYQPDLIWHDSGLGGMPGRPLEKGAGSIQESYIKEYLAYYFNKAKDWRKDVAVTYKQNDLPPEVGILDHERGRESSLTKHVWLTDDSGGGWFHKKDAYRDSDWLVKHLIEIVCRNGCLLLNIPPRPDGTFSKQVKECLRGTGDWLSVNGEAIYGTRPWKTCMEKTSRQEYSSDMRFTRSKNGDTIYVICLEWPGKELKVTSLRDDFWMCPSEIKQVKMLGTEEKLKWSRDDVFFHVTLPEKHSYKHAFVIKVEFKDKIGN